MSGAAVGAPGAQPMTTAGAPVAADARPIAT